VATLEWGVEVNLVELKDIQLPDSMKRAMARQAEAEREKRAKIIAAEGESMAAAALGEASDTMMAHPLALQLRNFADAGRARGGEEHHGGVPSADDECDRRDQQLPHSGNRRHARDHTPAGDGQTIGTTGASDNQRGAGERCGCGPGHAGV
jgi:SPFH domain / Band 7 family